jgi:hypothetical protein
MHELKDANLVFRALIILGIVAFAFFVAEDKGLVSLALDSDKSYISYLILSLYVLASAHWLWLAQRLGEERRRFAILEAATIDTDIVDPEGGLLGAFLRNLRSKSDSDPTALLDAFGDELANRHAIGHFTSDVLLKLGLLGTVERHERRHGRRALHDPGGLDHEHPFEAAVSSVGQLCRPAGHPAIRSGGCEAQSRCDIASTPKRSRRTRSPIFCSTPC